MIILGSFYLFIQKPAPEYHQFTPLIRIGDQTIAVEIADSEEERNSSVIEDVGEEVF